MDELISRQSAIDALEKWLHGLFGITEADGTATIFKTIRQLPPIQPEIIYCKDCSKHNVTISKAPYPFKEYICPLLTFRGEAQGHEFDYQFCAYGKKREVTT